MANQYVKMTDTGSSRKNKKTTKSSGGSGSTRQNGNYARYQQQKKQQGGNKTGQSARNGAKREPEKKASTAPSYDQELDDALSGAMQRSAARNLETATANLQALSGVKGPRTYKQLQQYNNALREYQQAYQASMDNGVFQTRDSNERGRLNMQNIRLKREIRNNDELLNLPKSEYYKQYYFPARNQNLSGAESTTARLNALRRNIAAQRGRGGSKKKADALQAEYDWLSEHQYDYWSQEELAQGIQSTGDKVQQHKADVDKYSSYSYRYHNNDWEQRSNEASRRQKAAQAQLDRMSAAKENNAYRDVLAGMSAADLKAMEDLASFTGTRSAARRAAVAGAGRRSRGTHGKINGYNDEIDRLKQYFRDKGYTDAQIESLSDYFLRNQHMLQRQQDMQELADWTGQNFGTKVLGSAISVPANLVSGLGYVDLALQNATAGTDAITGDRKRVDQYSGYSVFSDASSTIRGTVSEDMGGLGNFLYQTGMSMADFLAAAPTGNAATVLLGGSAAMQATRDAYARGASDRQALAVGGLAGVAEAAFEKLSLGNLRALQSSAQVAKRTFKQILKETAIQSGVEGSEEVFTTLANTLTDQMIMGDKNQIQTAIREYMAQGMSEEQATKKAYTDWWVGLAQDFAGGALSGGVIGGVGSYIGNASIDYGNWKTGSRIREAGNLQTLVDQGLAAPEGGAAYQAAQRTQEAKEGGIRQAIRAGETYRALQSADMRQAIESRLAEMGEKTPAETADAVMQSIFQQRLTRKESQLLKSRQAQRVLFEYKYAQRGLLEPAQWTQDLDAQSFERAAGLFTPSSVESEESGAKAFAERYGRQAEAVETVRKMNPELDDATFQAQFETAHMLGREGAAMETVNNTTATQQLTQEQRETAWQMGRAAAESDIDIMEGENENGGEVRLREGSERNDGARAAEPVRGLEKVAEPEKSYPAAVARSAKDEGADSVKFRPEAVSTQQLGVREGTSRKGLYIPEESSYTTAMKEAVRVAKENGRKIVLFGGGNLEVREDGYVVSARGMYDEATNTVYVRTDHPEYTADQIARHENGHGMIADGSIDVKELQKQIAASMTEAELRQAISDYVDLYDGTGLTEEQIIHEMICDALGNMNVFAEIDVFKEQAQRAERTMPAIRKAVQEQQKGRAPPEGTRAESDSVRFSMETPIEETKDLIAVHNLTYDNLRRAAKLGGIPMPSIAIIKGKNGFNQYGPMSLVFYKDTIDPKKNRKNKIYGADAWTPTAANARVEYPIDTDKSIKFERKISDLAEKVAGGIFSKTSVIRQRGIDEDTTMTAAELAERLSEDSSVRAAYLAEKGENVEKVMKKVEDFGDRGIGFVKKTIDAFGETTIRNLSESLYAGERLTDSQEDMLRELFRKDWIERLPVRLKDRRGMDFVEAKAKEHANNLHLAKMEDWIHEAAMYLEGGGIREEVDKIATDDAIKQKAPQKDVIAWLLPQIEELYGEPGIYNGSDPYTRSGNRKTFKQLHWDYTLGNIVKAMIKTAPQRGAGLYGVTPTGLQSVAAPEYRSIAEAKADSGRLARLSEEEYKSRLQEVEAEISYAIEAFLKDNPAYGEADSYYAVDSAGAAIIDIASKMPEDPGDVMMFAAAEGDSVTGNTAQRIYDVIQLAANLPTDYFEAKPQRAVGFEEVAQAIIPANAPSDIKNILNDLDVQVSEYEPENDDDRTKKLNAVEGAKFSRELDDEYLAAVRSGDTETAQRMVDEAARKAGYTVRAYHGTPNGAFNVFREWQYFTENKEYADRYQNQGASSNGYKPTATMPRTYDVYLKLENTFDTRKPRDRKIFNEEFYRQWGNGAPLSERGLPDWTDGDDFAEFFDENGYDYDSIYLDEGGTGGYGEEVQDRGISIAVKDPSQIKSADPVTYDDDGNVIPLSERFNPEQSDIRFSRDIESISELRRENRELSDYEVYNDRALISEDTLDKWLSGGYFGSSNPNYAQAYAAYMSPKDFITLTTSDAAQRNRIYDRAAESKTVENTVEQSKRQPIQLMIDHETGEVNGHEGRHRMVALQRAGVTQVPVLLFDSSNKYSKTHMDRLTLTGQFDSMASVDVRDLEPLSQGNRQTLVEKFATPTRREQQYEKYGNAKTVSFSRDLSALDSDYMTAVESGDMETAQRMVDEAAKKAGYTVHAYHGTNEQFTVFSRRAIGKNAGTGWGPGFYFTDRFEGGYEESAREYGGVVVNAYLKLTHPLTFDRKTISRDEFVQTMHEYESNRGRWAQHEFERVYDDSKSDAELFTAFDGRSMSQYRMTNDDVIDAFKSMGFDGLTGKFGNANHTIVFDSDQIKSADPVTYDDNGNIIPLSERFNPEQPDIRFSRDIESLTELRQENRELRERLERAKAQTRRTTEAAPREADVRKAARGVIKSAESKANLAEVTADMQELAVYMMNGEGKGKQREAASWTAVKERAVEIARDIVDNAKVLREGSDPELYKNMRQYVRGTKMTLAAEDRADMQDGYSEFVKSNRGTLRLGNDGVPVDTAYQELQDEFGKGFFPDDITHPADQLQRIADVVNGLKPIYEAPSGRYYNEAVEWTANAIIDELLGEDVRQEAPTYADKAEARRAADVARERNRADERVAAEREKAEKRRKEYMARSNAALQRVREQRDRKIEQLKQSFRESKIRDRERREESAGQRKYRERIEKKAKTLGDWLLKNSDKEHIPEPLKKVVGDFLSTLDFTSKRALKGGEATQKDAKYVKRLEALQEVVANQKAFQDGAENAQEMFGGYLDLPAGYMELLNEHLKTARAITENGETSVINAMSAEQLRQLDELITALMHSIRNINSLVSNGRYHSAIDAAQSTIGTLKPMTEYQLRRDSVKRFLQWDNTNPFYAFKRFGEGGKAIFEGLQNGWDRFAFNVKKVLDFAREAYTDKEVKAWAKDTHSFTLESGETIRMTTAQIMSLYELLKREQAVKHIMGGGVRVANIEEGKQKIQQTEHYHLTDADIKAITGTLTDRQREVANKLQRFMQEQGGKWGNEVSMRRFGYEAFGEENYFPIATEASDRNAVDPEAKANDLYRLLNMSATKSLNPKANNALVVSDIFDVFSDHMSDMAKYNALALPILDTMKWLNYREKVEVGTETGQFKTESLQRTIERAYGGGAMNWITSFMKDMNGVKETSGRGEGLARRMISNYKVAAVAANLRVAVLQPTAYVRASFVLKGKHLAKALAMTPKGLLRSVRECEEKSGIAAWKSLGFYDTNISRGVREQIHDGGGWKENLQEKAMIGAEWGDKLTWGVLWNACKVEQKEKGLTGDKLIEATAERFREVVYATQVVDSTMTRSHTMRGKSIYAGMATAFMSEPTLSYNMVLDAYMDYDAAKRSGNRSEAWKKSGGKFLKAVSVYCISATASAIVESLADAWRDDDDYEKFYQKFLEAMFGGSFSFSDIISGNLVNNLNIFTKIPFAKDFISYLQGFDSERLDTAGIADLVESLRILYEYAAVNLGLQDDYTKITYNGKMGWYGVLYRSLKGLSRMTGIPVSNGAREVANLWNNTVGLFAPSKKLKTYNAGVKSNVKKAIENGWLSEEDAIKELVGSESVDSEDEAFFLVRKWQTGDSKYDALVDAAAKGDNKAYEKELKVLAEHGIKEKEAQSAVKSALRELYQGVDEDGNKTGKPKISKKQAIESLVAFGGMKREDAEKRVQEWTAFNVTGIQYDDMKQAYLDGDMSEAQYKKALVQYGSMEPEEADKKIKKLQCQIEYGFEYGEEGIVSAAVNGDITLDEAKKIWVEYGGLNDKTADKRIERLQFVIDHPTVNYDDVNSDTVNGYNKYGAAANIPVEDYLEYVHTADSFDVDYDENGNSIKNSKKQKGVNYINSLPITSEQKTAVYLALWSAKTTPAWT